MGKIPLAVLRLSQLRTLFCSRHDSLLKVKIYGSSLGDSPSDVDIPGGQIKDNQKSLLTPSDFEANHISQTPPSLNISRGFGRGVH